MPVVGDQDLFEQRYTSRFRDRLVEHGLFIKYENDRAAIDLGLHLFDPAQTPGTVGSVRVWFQLKGIRASSLSPEQLAEHDSVAVGGLSVDHIRYWFAHPEPVYLACYVEALNQFLVADVRDLVEARGGLSWLRELKQCGQATTTLRISLAATLDNALDRMPRHRSMRMDGPEFRGRPLGHRLDPLRSELGIMTPDLFGDVVDRLLVAHGFVPDRDLDLSAFDSLGTVRATVGRLHYRYEWTSPLFTEFGFDRDSSFREESAPFGIQGDVLVVRHTEALQAPIGNEGVAEQMSQLIEEGVRDALVFVNASEGRAEFIGGWRVAALRPMRVQWPQGLGSLAYNVLTATNVYFEFVDRLPWRYINLQ